jgi:NadR type nicotinamide-nucleotide adenylyltransferase
MIPRIALYGPESTGKTRLAEKLAAHFGAPLVAEYAREFWDENGIITLEDIPGIAREQWRREDAAAATAGRLLICDTEALTTVLWSDLLYGTCPDDIRRGAERRCRDYALYLLLDIDVPFAPDPQRCFPDPADREKCRRVWRGALERRHLPFALITGDWAAREQRAITLVTALLAGA